MKKRIKKILIILPIIFTFILNIIPIGTASAADYDMSYFYSDSFLNSFDFGHDIWNQIYDYCDSKSYVKDQYYYEVSLSESSYNHYINGSGTCDVVCSVYFFKPNYRVDNSSFSDYYIYDSGIASRYKFTFRFDASDKQVPDPSSFSSSGSDVFRNFFYNKSDGRCAIYTSLNDSFVSPTYSEYYILYQDTNIDDFPLVPFNFVSSDLNVDVKFTPDLSGDVNRKSVDQNNNTSYSAGFKMKITNNNKFAIQYRFSIRDKEESDKFDESMGALVDTKVDYYSKFRPFVYYSNEWVYAHSLESEALHKNYSQTVNKASSWHYVPAGESVVVNFKYSQINLVENHYYYAEVYAQKVEGDYATEMYTVLPDTMENQATPLNLVYLSAFRMLQYSDVKYDPDDSSNGILPFNGSDYYDKYRYSYNALLDEDGNVDYTGKDLYNDPDSWYNNPTGVDSIKYNGGKSHLITSTSYSSLSSSVSGFFSFLTSIFNYLPSGVTSAIAFGFTGLVVICLVKVVFR
ncbi:MAG: hypothetical protein NC093_02580 [Alistipes sp.]|nr:hypothetical protein [Alistipes sp.]